MTQSEKWGEKIRVYQDWLETRHSNSDPIWGEIYQYSLEFCERRRAEELAKEAL